MKKLSNILFILGLLFGIISIYQFNKQTSPNRLSFASSPKFTNISVNQNTKKPKGIIIFSQNVWLPIVESSINNNVWETSPIAVSHLSNSTNPGNIGNAIFYGHNWPNLLGNLYKTKPGDQIQIVYSDNSRIDFEIDFIQEVSPTDVSILENTKDIRLTIFTCSGLFDSKRFVVIAKLKEPLKKSPQLVKI